MAPITLKEKAVDFLQRIVAGDIRGAYEEYAGEGFRHHNPWFAGDADSLRAGMEEDEARNPGKRLDVRLLLEEGNHVAVHSRLRRGASDPDIAVVHIFRFESGRIDELWDVAMAAPDKILNENGMF